ncbi:amino acid ABC transporter ATP-binding protein [Brevibacillus sp. NRS-1366]|uniref:amino acid ABC transporter ATP-binding protein n=1 Tax=Brevibacillus sp. NRS-1366 TaxID=3233899 RepID=UPI003D237316
MLYVSGLCKSFDGKAVLQDISLEIGRGTTTILIGPSGSGKSTLLNCLNLLETPDVGEMELNGHRLKFGKGEKYSEKERIAYRRQTGMVFQSHQLFPHRTALENVMEGLVVVKKMRNSEAKSRAERLLDKVGLFSLASRYPNQMSGGQQQRVGIARALAMEPTVLLFDEPTSALDPELVGEVLEVMKELTREGITLIISTHEMKFAREVADQVLFLDNGVVIDSGSPLHIFEDSPNDRVRRFLARFD